jgi:hypothetical protein
VILLASEGLAASEIARRLKTCLARVSKWRQRYAQGRLAGVENAARPGKPKNHDVKPGVQESRFGRGEVTLAETHDFCFWCLVSSRVFGIPLRT